MCRGTILPPTPGNRTARRGGGVYLPKGACFPCALPLWLIVSLLDARGPRHGDLIQFERWSFGKTGMSEKLGRKALLDNARTHPMCLGLFWL